MHSAEKRVLFPVGLRVVREDTSGEKLVGRREGRVCTEERTGADA